jgi:hypothetical protein
MFMNKAHLLLESLDLWKVVKFKVLPKMLESRVKISVTMRLNEIVRDGLLTLKRHLR